MQIREIEEVINEMNEAILKELGKENVDCEKVKMLTEAVTQLICATVTVKASITF